jgi:hypothetical protein
MRLALLVMTVSFVAPCVAAAQDPPRFGIVMAYPAQAGVLWKVTDRVAVRPEFNWTHSTIESTGTSTVFTGTGVTTTTVTTTTSTNGTGYGVSGLWYFARRDALWLYLSPRFAYTRTSSTADRPTIGLPNLPAPSPFTTTTSTYTTSGSFGAEYELAKRFGVFAELGVAYGRSNLGPTSAPGPDAHGSTTGIRSGIGAILFLGS